jgi:hypothetical protein
MSGAGPGPGLGGSPPLADPEPGMYRHYKGKLYELIGTATHSESGERLVVYRPCYGERALWVRPLAMFSEVIETPAGRVRRFERVES